MPRVLSDPTKTVVPGPAVMPSGAQPFGRSIREGPGGAASAGAATAAAMNAAAKAAPTIEQVLLDNVQPNPDGTPCFTYQQKVVDGVSYVVGVAITLTVRTQDRDPITRQVQTETKALLNVSPRNVFNVWQMAGLGNTNRVQPTPATVTALLP